MMSQHSQIPTWVQNLGKADLLSALTNHITKVMTHYGDSCYAWDVVNEVIGDDATYRKSFWYTKTGTDYIATAFKTASAVKKKLGLSVKLYYNDYSTDTINAKSTAGYNMVKWLQGQGIEINGVGFQSHLTYGLTVSTADMVKNFNRFTALGLDVAVTELDINTKTTKPKTNVQNQVVIQYQSIVAACKQVSKCVGVTIWDFVDSYTWLSNSAPLPWYQPSGKNTKLVRKAIYDGIVRGWST
jgi:GH35 family endo-1,4-beta-xylanase